MDPLGIASFEKVNGCGASVCTGLFTTGFGVHWINAQEFGVFGVHFATIICARCRLMDPNDCGHFCWDSSSSIDGCC